MMPHLFRGLPAFGVLFGVTCATALRVPVTRVGANARPGHVISGVDIKAAGVVPYVAVPGRGVFFLLQRATNGTRAGQLSDFGGRREEEDEDAFETAARELCEETDFHLGGVSDLARSLRTSSSVRIINKAGGYVCFFLKVGPSAYRHDVSEQLPAVDATAEELVERDFRWWRADELLGVVPEDEVVGRMVTPSAPLPLGVSEAAARSASEEASAPPLSSFHRAVCKTLALENANAYDHERWHHTVLARLASAEAQKSADAAEEERLHSSLATAAVPARAAPPALASSPRRRRKSGASANGAPDAPAKRGSRRGPPKVQLPEWELAPNKVQTLSPAAAHKKRPPPPRERAPVRRKRSARPAVEVAEVAAELRMSDFSP